MKLSSGKTGGILSPRSVACGILQAVGLTMTKSKKPASVTTSCIGSSPEASSTLTTMTASTGNSMKSFVSEVISPSGGPKYSCGEPTPATRNAPDSTDQSFTFSKANASGENDEARSIFNSMESFRVVRTDMLNVSAHDRVFKYCRSLKQNPLFCGRSLRRGTHRGVSYRFTDGWPDI